MNKKLLTKKTVKNVRIERILMFFESLFPLLYYIGPSFQLVSHMFHILTGILPSSYYRRQSYKILVLKKSKVVLLSLSVQF